MSLSEITVRPAQSQDQEALFYLHNDIADTEATAHLRQLVDNAEGVWVLVADRVLVGYTAVFGVPGLDGLLEMQGGIASAYRRRGLGSVLLQGVIEALRPSSFDTLSYPVDDMDTAVAHFLHHHNFWVEHEEWQMVYPDLTNLPPIPVNSCYLQTLPRRQAIAQFLALYDDSFAGTPWNQPFSQAEMAATLVDTDEILFLVDGDRFVGCTLLRYPLAHHAEIEPLGIIKAEQGKGYGRIFFTSILHKFAQQNRQTATLGVWANNHNAIALYQSIGFVHTDTVTYLAHSL